MNMSAFKTVDEFLFWQIALSKAYVPVQKKQLLELAKERNIKCSDKMLKPQIVQTMLDGGITLNEMYELANGGIGIIKYNFFTKFDISDYAFSKLNRAGIFRKTGGYFRSKHELYNVYDYYKYTKEEIDEWLNTNLNARESKAYGKKTLCERYDLTEEDIQTLKVAKVIKNHYGKICILYYEQDAKELREQKERMKEL